MILDAKEEILKNGNLFELRCKLHREGASHHSKEFNNLKDIPLPE
jgi:hypothetical protein